MVPVDISLGHWEDENQRHAIAYVRDLRERKGFEDSLHHRATHDQLTDLPNRWMFNLQLDQALAHGKRVGRRVAVLFLDLDDFKTVNDTFGHGPGDGLLIQVGQRLRQVLRENDLLARLGGDEFALLLSDIGDTTEATVVAAKLLAALDEPFVVGGHDVLAGSSIGVAFHPDDAQDREGLMRCAAMYQAKRSGRGSCLLFGAPEPQCARESAVAPCASRRRSGAAIGLHYQPQVDVLSGAIVGVEARAGMTRCWARCRPRASSRWPSRPA
jgi:diguanylate cyclase (GGDEF)-like protein